LCHSDVPLDENHATWMNHCKSNCPENPRHQGEL
jgi:hypothetical protein